MIQTKRPRPRSNDEDVIRAAVMRMIDQFASYCECEEGDEGTKKEIVEDLVKALEYEDDSYRVARHLEDIGWLPDCVCVELCDSLIMYREAELLSFEKAWAAEENIKPEYNLNDVVLYKGTQHRVVNIQDRSATYALCAELNLSKFSYMQGAWIVPWESKDIQPLNASVAESADAAALKAADENRAGSNPATGT